MMKKSFWYNSDQNGDLLKPRTGHGQYVVDIDNMLFAITGLSNILMIKASPGKVLQKWADRRRKRRRAKSRQRKNLFLKH